MFLPGESHGQRSLVGCSPWGHTEQTPVRFPLVAASGGFSLVWGRGLLTAAPSLSQGTGSRPAGSAVAVQQLSCSTVCGISPDQGWDPRALHWQGVLGPSMLRCLSFHPEIFLYYFFIIFFSPIPPPPRYGDFRMDPLIFFPFLFSHLSFCTIF